MTKKSRLDLYLLTKGLAKTRQEAQKLIRAGKVKTINGQILDKPGQEVLKDLEIEVTQPLRYVSRGGEKLVEAFNQFPIDIKNRVCLDAGISTGGFTDCLLQLGAANGHVQHLPSQLYLYLPQIEVSLVKPIRRAHR